MALGIGHPSCANSYWIEAHALFAIVDRAMTALMSIMSVEPPSGTLARRQTIDQLSALHDGRTAPSAPLRQPIDPTLGHMLAGLSAFTTSARAPSQRQARERTSPAYRTCSDNCRLGSLDEWLASTSAEILVR